MAILHRVRWPLGLTLSFLLGASVAAASCLDFGGFAIFQCANLDFFPPLPTPVAFDPNDHPTNVSVAFWQIGFGNRNVNSGSGTTGTGMTGAATFNGNDSGVFLPELKDALVATGGTFPIPAGSICLLSNNWGNSGIDGCCDNVRDPNQAFGDDGLLNPYMDVYQSHYGYQGQYSRAWQQDYPMAVLLRAPAAHVACDHSPICAGATSTTCTSGPRAGKTCIFESDCDFCSGGPSAGVLCADDTQCADGSVARYFAFAAVATLNRGNDGTGHNGPCASVNPGTNPAPCDFRRGFFDFSTIVNGQTNPANGHPTVVPWQEAPRPQLTCASGCAGVGPRTVNASWIPNVLYHDGSVRPSTNSKLAPADPSRAAGVGVLDVAAKFPIIRYQMEAAPVSCANVDANDVVQPATMAWTPVGPETSSPAISGLSVSGDACFRIRTLLGKRPETSGVSIPNCRLGKCGDIGYDAVRTDPGAIMCASVSTATPVGFVPGDADGDGVSGCGNHDCNDADAGSIASPRGVLLVDIEDLPGNGLRYHWVDQGPAAGMGTHYDVFGGSGADYPLGNLPAGSCLADNVATPYFDFPGAGPPAGHAAYFMVRGQNGCAGGTGTYGNPGRDAGAGQSPQACD